MLLVLGPHRSGTSLTARMLECLGAVNSKNLSPPNDYNPVGHFEDWDIYQFNEHVLLPALGKSWHSLGQIEWRRLSDEGHAKLQAEAVTIVRTNYNPQHSLSVLKEPRIARLLPFWLPVLLRCGFGCKLVLPVRDPLSTARSLRARDGFPIEYGEMLYARSWLSILSDSEGIPKTFLALEAIFQNPEMTLLKAADDLGLVVPEEFRLKVHTFKEAFLEHSLLHHKPEHTAETTRSPTVATRIYHVLSSALTIPDDVSLSRKVEEIGEDFDRLGPFLNEYDQQAARLRAENLAALDQQIARVTELEKRVSDLVTSTCWRMTKPLRWLMDTARCRSRPPSESHATHYSAGESNAVLRAVTQTRASLIEKRLRSKFAGSGTSLPAIISALPFFDAEAYCHAHPDLPEAIDAAKHAGLSGIYEGRRILFPGPVEAAMKTLTPSSTASDATQSHFSFSECRIFASSRGHFFMREIAEHLAADLRDAGINSEVFDENCPPAADDRARNVIVAPHEFFCRDFHNEGQHASWLDANFHVLNTEQPHTSWFDEAFRYLLLADGVLDLSPHTAEALRRSGLNAWAYVPRPRCDDSYLRFTPGACPVLASYPDLCKPSHVSSPLDAGRPIDISFVGGPSSRREQFFCRAARHLANWRCCLHYRKGYHSPLPFKWPHDPEISLGHYLARHSKIYLNIHRDDVGYFELHRIVMHGLANGALVVSEEGVRHPDFPAGESYLSAPLEDLPELLRFLLDSDEGRIRREEVARRGHLSYLKSFGEMYSASSLLQALDARP